MNVNKSLILNNIKNYYGFKSDAEFARFLDIKPQTLASWHSRNTFDIELLYSKCVDFSTEWLLTGKGEMLKDIQTSIKIKTLGERVEYYKRQNSLTYYDLGSILGITPGAMRGLINRNEITEEYINAISEKFGISKEWFLKGKGEMPKIVNNKEVRENINNLVVEPTPTYKKEDNSKITILEKENEFLKENITSIKETNELLKYKIKSLEVENQNLKERLINKNLK